MNLSCTYDRVLAEAHPDTMSVCYHWTATILLGFYMLITNILLLNLLIAIFRSAYHVAPLGLGLSPIVPRSMRGGGRSGVGLHIFIRQSSIVE